MNVFNIWLKNIQQILQLAYFWVPYNYNVAYFYANIVVKKIHIF